MSVSIETVTIDGVPDKRIAIQNSQVARKFSYGSSWGWIRIGFHLSFVDTGGNIGSLGNTWFGVMASPTTNCSNGPMTSACSHFVGVYLVGSGTRYTSPVVFQRLSGVRLVKRIGASITSIATPNNTIVIPASSALVRSPFFMDISKTGGNVIMGLSYPTDGTAAAKNVTPEQMMDYMGIRLITDVRDAIAVGGGSYYNMDYYTFTTLDEATYGYLDAVVIGWQSSVALHGSGIYIRKMR